MFPDVSPLRGSIAGRHAGATRLCPRRPHPALVDQGPPQRVLRWDILQELGALDAAQVQTASWWTDTQGALDGRRPVDVLNDYPGTVFAAAHREAADWDSDTGVAAGWAR